MPLQGDLLKASAQSREELLAGRGRTGPLYTRIWGVWHLFKRCRGNDIRLNDGVGERIDARSKSEHLCGDCLNRLLEDVRTAWLWLALTEARASSPKSTLAARAMWRRFIFCTADRVASRPPNGTIREVGLLCETMRTRAQVDMPPADVLAARAYASVAVRSVKDDPEKLYRRFPTGGQLVDFVVCARPRDRYEKRPAKLFWQSMDDAEETLVNAYLQTGSWQSAVTVLSDFEKFRQRLRVDDQALDTSWEALGSSPPVDLSTVTSTDLAGLVFDALTRRTEAFDAAYNLVLDMLSLFDPDGQSLWVDVHVDCTEGWGWCATQFGWDIKRDQYNGWDVRGQAPLPVAYLLALGSPNQNAFVRLSDEARKVVSATELLRSEKADGNALTMELVRQAMLVCGASVPQRACA